jgi:uncharacterized protein YjiS (DUF1127 family)
MSAILAVCTTRSVLLERSRLTRLLIRLSTTTEVWIERSRQRYALSELADRNDYLLADIGLSLEEARREACKPFWVFLENGNSHQPMRTAVKTGRRKP